MFLLGFFLIVYLLKLIIWMKNVLLLFYIMYSLQSVSQVEKDTMGIDFVRKEYFFQKGKDSSLQRVLTKYKSGIYKSETGFFDTKKPIEVIYSENEPIYWSSSNRIGGDEFLFYRPF